MKIYTYDTEAQFLEAMDGKIHAIMRTTPDNRKIYLCDLHEDDNNAMIRDGYIDATDELTCTNANAEFVFANRTEIVIKENL